MTHLPIKWNKFPYTINSLNLCARCHKHNEFLRILHKPWIFIGSMEISLQAESEKTLKFWRKTIFGKFIGKKMLMDLRKIYVITWRYGQKYKNMTSSEQCTYTSYFYVGFYVNTWNWKYIKTQARCKVPRPMGRRKIWIRQKGAPFWLWFWKKYVSLKKVHNGGWARQFFAQDREGVNCSNY